MHLQRASCFSRCAKIRFQCWRKSVHNNIVQQIF